jgi:hypothetical protein
MIIKLYKNWNTIEVQTYKHGASWDITIVSSTLLSIYYCFELVARSTIIRNYCRDLETERIGLC